MLFENATADMLEGMGFKQSNSSKTGFEWTSDETGLCLFFTSNSRAKAEDFSKRWNGMDGWTGRKFIEPVMKDGGTVEYQVLFEKYLQED